MLPCNGQDTAQGMSVQRGYKSQMRFRVANLFGTRERRRRLCDTLHITFLVCSLCLVSVHQRGSTGTTHVNELLRVRQRQLTSQRLLEALLPSLHIWKRDKLAYMHPRCTNQWKE
jgi:hypothetical protein